MATERDRAHLVISLGEGAEGQKNRDTLDRRAEQAGKAVSAWARETLLEAATGGEDPIVEVTKTGISGVGWQVLLDLRGVVAMYAHPEPPSSLAPVSKLKNVGARISGDEWDTFGCPDADALIERWKRIKRGL